MSYESRKNKADKYREIAAKKRENSTAAYERSNAAVAGIPMGQPILVGHYSEKAHRSALKRCHRAMDTSVEEGKKADYYERKAEAAENNTAIYADDPQAVEKLQDKLNGLVAKQDQMKAANKIFKSKKLSKEEKIVLLSEIGVSESFATSRMRGEFCSNFGFAGYELTNNNAKINDSRKRLERMKKLRETPTEEYKVNGYDVCYNTEEARFQIFFGFKPDEEVRTRLKRAGFRWSPTNEAWQCGLNRWIIEEGKKILESMPAKE